MNETLDKGWSNYGIGTFQIKYKWRLQITDNFAIMIKEAPNCFHRKMQELIFGFRYIKLQEK